MNLALVSLIWWTNSEEVYPGFDPVMQPPAPMTASQIKGYQIYCCPRIDLVSQVTRRLVKQKKAAVAVLSNRRDLTLL